MTVRKKVSEEEKTDAKNAITKDDNTFKVMMKIFQNEGLGGLFSGLGPALILVSSPVIQFTIFEQLKNLLLNVNRKNGVSKNKITPLEALFLGSLGKLVATLATYPYYTIRSRMHLNKSNDASSFKFLTGMVQNEGILSLYRGLDAKLLQSILSSGLIFYFKEELMLLVETFLGLANTNAGNLVNVVSKITKRK